MYDFVPESITDADENTYNIVRIGKQLWTSENLRTTRFSNGEEVPRERGVWQEETPYYDIAPHAGVQGIDSEEEMVDAYGFHYNYHAVFDQRGLCPTGWRVSTIDDWDELIDFVMAHYHNTTHDNAGNVLKIDRQVDSPLEDAATNVHPRWDADDTHHANNRSGLSLVPGGGRHVNGSVNNLGQWGTYWEYGRQAANLRADYGDVRRMNWHTNSGYAVRCVADFEGYEVKFTITDADGQQPIEEAIITLGAKTVKADASGQKRFHLPEGTHTYGVDAEGYEPVADQSFTIDGEDIEVTVAMDRITSAISPIAGEIKVFPNPADQILWIDFGNLHIDQAAVTLHDLTGQLVLRRNFSINGLQMKGLEINHLTPGVYLLNVSTKQHEVVKRVVVQ